MKLTTASFQTFCQSGFSSAHALLLYGEEPYFLTPYLNRLLPKLSTGVKKYMAADFLKQKVFLSDIVTGGDLFGNAPPCPWIEDVNDKCVDFLQDYLGSQAAPSQRPLILLTASYLKPTSKLRKLFEAEKTLLVLACFAPKVADIKENIRTHLAKDKMRIQPEALDYFANFLLPQPYLLASEIEKCILYLYPAKDITLNALKAILGQSSLRFEEDALLHLLSGNLAAVMAVYQRDHGTTQDVVGFLRRLSYTLLRLYTVQLARERGASLEDAGKKVSPPFFPFFLRSIQSVLSKWSARQLFTLFQKIIDLEHMCKKNFTFAETLLFQSLFSCLPSKVQAC